MKAVVFSEYGGPEVLRLDEIKKPLPKANEVLIKVYATAVNLGDCRIRRADPWAVKLFMGLSKPRIPVLGVVYAGIIEEVGNEVSRFKAGDKVYGMTGMKLGAYAEYTCVKEKGCITFMPQGISFEEAASVPFGATTALSFLDKTHISPGRKVLINGASGAVGTAAVQIANDAGAEVTGVCSAENAELVLSLGASSVIDYKKEDFTKTKVRYDIIFETVGKVRYPECLPLLKSNGVLILGSADFKDMFTSKFAKKGESKRILTGANAESADDLVTIRKMIEEGFYKPVVDRIYTLDQIVEAHRYTETGRKKGNVAITVSQVVD